MFCWPPVVSMCGQFLLAPGLCCSALSWQLTIKSHNGAKNQQCQKTAHPTNTKTMSGIRKIIQSMDCSPRDSAPFKEQSDWFEQLANGADWCL